MASLCLLSLALLILALLLIAHALIQRLHPAYEIARLVGRACYRILLGGLAHGAGRVGDFLLQRLEVRADVVFHPARVLGTGALQRALGIPDLLADALVANRAGCLVELARGIFLVAAHFIRDLFELLLEIGDLRVHRVLALAERLRLGGTSGAGLPLIERVHVGGDFLLFLGELLGLALRALEVPFATSALVAFELLLRVAQPIERLVRLRAAVLRSIGRCPTHRIGRILQLLHRVAELLALLLIARELFELARRLLRFFRQRALRGAGVP